MAYGLQRIVDLVCNGGSHATDRRQFLGAQKCFFRALTKNTSGSSEYSLRSTKAKYRSARLSRAHPHGTGMSASVWWKIYSSGGRKALYNDRSLIFCVRDARPL